MSHPIREQIAADFEKVKTAGSARAARIGKIFQAAFAETATELKQGTGEIRSIANDSKSTWLNNLKDQPTSAQTVVTPVEVVIEDDATEQAITEPAVQNPVTEPVTVAPVTVAPVTVVPVTEPVTVAIVEEQQPTDLNPAVAETVAETQISIVEHQPDTQENASEHGFSDLLQALVQRWLSAIRQAEAYATIQRQITRVKEQIVILDAKLAARYGDRYASIKQDFQQDAEQVKAWYNKSKAEAAVSGTYWVEEKQSEVHDKMGQAGTTIAQKEQKIKQLLKELWQTVKS